MVLTLFIYIKKEGLDSMFRIYDTQKKEWRDEESNDKNRLMEEFREYWDTINYDSEYEDIINSDLDESASKEDVESIMQERVYGVTAEEYLKQNGFVAKQYTK